MSTAEHAQNPSLTTEQIAAAGAGPGPDEAGGGIRETAGSGPDATGAWPVPPGAPARPVTPEPAVPAEDEDASRPAGDLDPALDGQAQRQDWAGQQQAADPLASQDLAADQGASAPGLAAAVPTQPREPQPDFGPAAGNGAVAAGTADAGTADAGTAADSPMPADGAGPAGPPAGAHARLLAEDEMNSIVSRWKSIQADFVDEPRKAVEQADALVAELMQRLASMFAAERADLERRWSGGGDGVSTEDLRVSLRRYRSFFERLLAA